MADKPTMPRPAEGTRRRKRPAPTIDLTATEVPATGAADEPQTAAGESAPESHPAREQPDTAPESEPAAGRDETSQKLSPAVHFTWQMLFAGFSGAAIMTTALLALWFAGLVPARHARPVSTDTSSIAALNERVGKVEAAITRIPGSDPALAERLSAADNAMKSLGIALTALNKRSDDLASNVAQARARAEASEKALSELRSSVQDLTKNASSGLSPADIDTLKKRLAALEQTAKTVTVDNAARLALSAAALRDATASGVPFTAELDEVKSLGAAENILAALVPFAESGVPTAAALAQELRALMPAMVKVSGAPATTGSFLQRLEANAGKLVRIRPVDTQVGDDASTVLARIELEIARADIDSALRDLAKLDGETRAPAQDWIAKAQARQAAIAAARQIASGAARALGRQ